MDSASLQSVDPGRVLQEPRLPLPATRTARTAVGALSASTTLEQPLSILPADGWTRVSLLLSRQIPVVGQARPQGQNLSRPAPTLPGMPDPPYPRCSRGRHSEFLRLPFWSSRTSGLRCSGNGMTLGSPSKAIVNALLNSCFPLESLDITVPIGIPKTTE